MRGRTPQRASRRLAAAGVTVLALTLVVPSGPAKASRPARTAWWQSVNQSGLQAPAPPDVPAGGLYIQGGPSADQPSAIGAVGFDVPNGSGPRTLKLHLATITSAASGGAPTALPQAPASPAAPPALQACLITAGTFSPEENGPAADIPPYSCAGGVDGVAAADGTITFAVANLARAGSLTVAIVPKGSSDRASISPPGDDALSVEALPVDEAPTTADASAELQPSAGLYPSYPSLPTASPLPSGSGALITPPTTTARRATPLRAAPITVIRPDTFTKVGQLLAIGLLLAALVSYVRGYGLLGGRIVET